MATKSKIIRGNVNLMYCKNLKRISGVTKIKGSIDLYGCNIFSDLGDLIEVNNFIDLRTTAIKTLGKLQKVGSINLSLTGIQDLGNLEIVTKHINISNTNLDNLGKLKTVGGRIILRDSKITKEYVRKYKPELFESCEW